MIQKHPELRLTIRSDQRLFRYMDIYKLFYLLCNNALYFSTLAALPDAFEGRLTEKTIREWLSHELPKAKEKIVIENASKLNGSTRAYLKVCCFSISNVENEILWDHYGHSEYSVCIQTSLDRITEAFKNTPEDISAGEMQYINRNEHTNESMNLYSIASLKSEEYRAENELRLIVMTPDPSTGVSLSVDVQKLVERIIVSPKCDDWKLDIIQNLVTRCGLNLKVEKSTIIYQDLHI